MKNLVGDSSHLATQRSVEGTDLRTAALVENCLQDAADRTEFLAGILTGGSDLQINLEAMVPQYADGFRATLDSSPDRSALVYESTKIAAQMLVPLRLVQGTRINSVTAMFRGRRHLSLPDLPASLALVRYQSTFALPFQIAKVTPDTSTLENYENVQQLSIVLAEPHTVGYGEYYAFFTGEDGLGAISDGALFWRLVTTILPRG
jgi:hypothetical protein